MKKLIVLLLAFCILISQTACKKKTQKPADQTDIPTNPVTGTNDLTYNPPMETDDTLISVSVPAITDNTIHADGTTLFQYTYQNMSLVLDKPQVADKIILDFLKRVDNTSATADSTKEMALSAYNGSQNWIPYLYHITYSPTRIDHKVLSLFGNNVVFSGAGHPERTCVSASYDLLTGDVLTLASIMHKDATVQQIFDLVIIELEKIAKSNYLYNDYQSNVKNRFMNSDPAHDELWYFSQTGLCFYFAPYEIAPYSSGVITVEIPYAKLTKLVHEAYLPLSRNSSDGKIKVTAFNNINLDKFSHISEIVTEKNGKMYMIHADKTIQDIRIEYTDKSDSYIVFAAYNLLPDNGIMIQGNDETLKNMKITYKSGNEIVTAPVI